MGDGSLSASALRMDADKKQTEGGMGGAKLMQQSPQRVHHPLLVSNGTPLCFFFGSDQDELA